MSQEWFPLAKAGGGAQAWAASFAVAVFTLFVVDYVCIRPFLTRGRWFTLHVFANAVIMVFTFEDLYYLFTDPVKSVILSDTIRSRNPLMFNLAIHCYHVVMFDDLTWLDWLHHGLMTFLAIPACFPVGRMGALMNVVHFFVTGLPGGLDYLLLALVQNEKIERLTEKRINNSLNVWLRAPGIVGTTTLFLISSVERVGAASGLELFCRGLLVLLFFWNAQFFLERVVANYHVVSYKIVQKNKQEQVAELDKAQAEVLKKRTYQHGSNLPSCEKSPVSKKFA
eukprot:m.280471 g.280471  ORF g.280471 m.280471 type:complete len:282 (-) comp108204_c0_seq1:80-925(-)